MTYTTDLVEPHDLPMVDHIRTQTPLLQLGAIGQPTPPPGLAGFPTHYTHLSNNAYNGHAANRDRERDHEADVSKSSVDDDLTTLIAHAHRQRELEMSKHAATAAVDGISGMGSQTGEISLAGAYSRRWAENGDVDRAPGTAFGYGMGTRQGNGLGNGTVRFDEDPWERNTILSTHRATNRSPNAVPIGRAGIPAPPKSAPLPLSFPSFQPFSDPPKLPPIQAHQYPQSAHPQAQASQAALYQSPPDQPIFNPPPTTPSTKDTVHQVTKHLEGLTVLLSPLLAQSQELEQLRQEVKMWKSEWSKADIEVKRLQEVIAKPKAITHGRFTAVLIDGDGLIFQESFIGQGFAGGLKAAQALLTALPTLSLSASINSDSPTLELRVASSGNGTTGVSGENVREGADTTSTGLGRAVVQIFVNKQGLGTTLVKTGLVASYNKYEQFWQGFSSAHELFTVCDVGPGKEASDAKIREHLKLYAKNAQCEMIVLGATHDNGYANILSSLQTESRLSKLLLLKGYEDIAGQLKPYASRVVTIPDLFRTVKIPPVPTTFSSVVRETPAVAKDSPPPSAAVVKKKWVKEDTTSESTPSDGGVEVLDWSVMTPVDANHLGKGTVSVPKKSKGSSRAGDDNGWESTEKKKKKDKKNKFYKRLTEAVRNLDPRPCHTFYLSPWGCKNGNDCKYGHEYDLEGPQLEELARLAKSIMCPYIKDDRCRYTDDECVYGHKCPNQDNCPFGDTCRFHSIPNGHGELD